MAPKCTECIDGRYGPSCQQQCGKCFMGDPCDKTNGMCISGCNPGWSGATCDTGKDYFIDRIREYFSETYQIFSARIK